MTAPLRVGIAGLGTVGASVFHLLEEQVARLSDRTQRHIIVTAVSARSKKKRGLDLSRVKWHNNPVDLARDPNVDVVVELMGGSKGAAFDLIKTALANGKQVVTANKALLALRGKEFLGSSIAYEAAVAGGVPVIKTLREGMAANGLRAVYGILNGTCNFILSEMYTTGRAFADVLKEAQAKGYAEADPSFDVDGIDAGHKIAILAALAFGGVPDFANVKTKGIRDISPFDIAFAQELGYRIKLLGIARATPRGIEQSVEPCLVPKKSAVAHVEGALNAVYLDGDYAGKILLTGAGAGGAATASAVVADIVDIARGHKLPVFSAGKLKAASLEKRIGSYFLRLIVLDKPGVIADVSAILRDCKVSLESVLQRSHAPGQPVPLILTTHETPEGDIQRAITKIAKLKSVVEKPHVMRIEGFES